MKTLSKLLIFYAIVASFIVLLWYMVLFGSTSSYDILKVREKPESENLGYDQSTFSLVKHGCENRYRPFSDVPDSQEIGEIEPYETADTLYGKELYIFYISQIHEQHYPDVDPYIALAILETESNYQPNLRSSAGAIGLMQVIPQYHSSRVEKYGLNDLWDPYTNIICGMDLLNDLYHIHGSWSRGLLGYNNSISYVNHVLAKADILRGGSYFGDQASENSGSS